MALTAAGTEHSPQATTFDWFAPNVRKFVLPALVLVVILATWEYVTANGLINKLILASPSAIAQALMTAWPEILSNMLVTLTQALIGFALGNFLGLLVAVIFVHSGLARRTIYPIAIAAEAVPIVAVVPVLILWLGNGMEPKIFITAFLTFFPMLVNAFRGLQSADGEVKELLFTLSASPLQTLIMVRLPASIPFLFNALKLSACACIVASIVAEWLASDQGLGHLIVLYGARYQIPEVWATALVATVMSLIVYGLVVLAERAALPWKRGLSTPPS
jgi:ABC-type nitrate/sulfonate/bicarbonate transport system permease component